MNARPFLKQMCHLVALAMDVQACFTLYAGTNDGVWEWALE